MKTEINSGMKTTEMLTCNIAKSGEVLNFGGVSPFGHHLGLIRYHSQSASCHIAIRYNSYKAILIGRFF